MRTLCLFTMLLAVSLSTATAVAQDANEPAPATKIDQDNRPADDAPPAKADDAEAIRAIVRSVKGICEKRDATKEDAKWTAIKKDDELGGMMLVRTGLGAELELAFSDRCRMTVRQATKIGIREFYRRGDKASGKLGVKYGSVRAKVNSAAGENDIRVSTPVATLSVRGSGGTLGMWGDMGLFFRGQSGQWMLKTPTGKTRTVKGGEWTNDQGERSGELLAMFRHVPFGDPLGGITRRELRHLRQRGGDGRGVIGFMGSGHQFTVLMGFEYSSHGRNGNDNGFGGEPSFGQDPEKRYEPGYEENP
jgi:hypothetical protein